jgi:hypothetical protein
MLRDFALHGTLGANYGNAKIYKAAHPIR